MAEVQTSTNSGAIAQRFVEFVMMHAQNAALFLGQIPNPHSGEAEVNLDLAKMFIDQLEMIQEKTRGNLSNEEAAVLRNALSNLQLAYVEVARSQGTTAPAPHSASPPPPSSKPSQAAQSTAPLPSPTAGGESESRKKFTKSYGA
ncbi:MAG: DUF1844 domain-containing protein [Verrucomicrobia bacterium]|nr:DUF1844 domain-containing protein [Verrucomicrobiota bacterium]